MEKHYQKLAEALLWALEKGLGDAFREDVKHAWIAVYFSQANAKKRAAMKTDL